LMEKYAAIDPDFSLFGTSHESRSDADVVRAHQLLGYLRQPFLVAEPFTGRSGEWMSQGRLLDDVEVILGP
jgi:F0F1-type ATP synthase beta subunit